ncbi:hypothetical protein BKH41_04565 [Helicobacter sp. 12S02232-10]|uniref:chorismate-binding protein n=1 Tax=Helicobacter sp. 12S02232-10 TaxID=1476197 RepID=UPI000BA793CE|nr:chorismate-binding protein [Helicobacter sp. 12S02232-10]PAF48905.1 hypothetical protein BKH41_04565 [Helicobacter sp. 12S02232-10]
MIFGDKLYYQSLKKLVAFDRKGLIQAFDYIDSHRHRGYFVGYVKYEAKDIFLGKDIVLKEPLLYFEHFAKSRPFPLKKNIWNAFYPHLKPQIDFYVYKDKIVSIKEAIAKGDTYQTNFTYPIDIFTHCDEESVFYSILNNQDTPYKAFITNEFESILSFSPELFFEITSKGANHSIIARPMKGTIQRGADQEEDLKNKAFLKNDIKNQSENVMIVDLLRNDLSKIALKGSVEVSKLFEIQTHPTLHQMISEITAEIPKDISLYNIFNSLFPCGSITGAPKIKTMEIISKLETKDRGIYCGAIGVIDKVGMRFSVPIRTLYKKCKHKTYTLNVGGGIVWDSKTSEEWDETKLKSLFIYPKIDFCLVETMRVQDLKIIDFSLHLKRLRRAADYFGFKFDDSLQALKPQKDGILRILSDKNGHTSKIYSEWLLPASNKIILSNEFLDNRNDFLYYKTTYRPWYEKSMQKITEGMIFDEVFYNQNGELTEGARSNLVLEIDGNLFTPPIECGLLGGIYREKLLAQHMCVEKILRLSDLKQADKIYCINSVRGMTLVEVQK